MAKLHWPMKRQQIIEQTAEGCHRKKKKRLPSGTSFNADAFGLLGGKQAVTNYTYILDFQKGKILTSYQRKSTRLCHFEIILPGSLNRAAYSQSQ